MATVKRPYGPYGRAMFDKLKSEGLLKVEAFVSWLAARGIKVDRTLVSHWRATRSHLPADVLPLLAEFTGRPDVVFGEFTRPLGWDVFPIPTGPPADRELIDLILEAAASLGRLQRALYEARLPDSPGGTAITNGERDQLRQRLDELIRHLADVRARLGGTPPSSQGQTSQP
jgi:hypothetical protein